MMESRDISVGPHNVFSIDSITAAQIPLQYEFQKRKTVQMIEFQNSAYLTLKTSLDFSDFYDILFSIMLISYVCTKDRQFQFINH